MPKKKNQAMNEKWTYVLAVATIALSLATPAFAHQVNHSEEPGSVIVFHKFISGFVGDRPATQFEISATCPKNFRCAGGQLVNLRAHWVCPPDPGDRIVEDERNVCRETDFNLSTTVNGTLVFDAAGGGAPFPPCRRGYLIAWVIDDFGNGVKFDSLIGDAVIATGPTSARAYNALPIQAAEDLATNTIITGDNGPLLFDGAKYKAVTGKIFGTVRYESDFPPIRTDLTLLTLDVHSNLPNETTFVGLNFYNEGEVLHSTATNFTCWAERSIREIDRSLDAGFGEKGLVESTYAVQGTTPVTLVGILETSEEVTLPITAPEQTVTVTVFLPSICLPAQAIGGCMFIPGRGCPIVANGTVISCTGTAPPQFLEILATRDHAYSLYNDSTPVPTRFEPSAVTDAALAPSPGLTRIEETDRSIDYAGTGWVHGNMSFPWSGGTASFSRRAGDRATLSFSGTGVSWISFREARGGIARVFLDGTLVDEVDTFSTTTEIQAVVFTRSGLPAGPHTLAIEVTGTHNPASTTSDTVIVVDAFDVTP